MRFVLLPGNRFDTVGVAPLIKGIKFDAMLADKAFDSNWIIAEMNERGAVICISQHPRRTEPLPVDLDLSKSRHLIDLRQENDPPDRFLIFLIFCKLKEFKRIALRADKTDTSFAAMIYAAASLINSH